MASDVCECEIGDTDADRAGLQDLRDPPIRLETVSWDVWGVLGLSFGVDGYVLTRSILAILSTKPPDITFFRHFQKLRDPTTLVSRPCVVSCVSSRWWHMSSLARMSVCRLPPQAVLLEDGAACIGVLIAIAGLGASQMTGSPTWDSIAGVTISCLLAAMGLILARLNERFLLGQAIDPGAFGDHQDLKHFGRLIPSMRPSLHAEITADIEEILQSRPSIDSVSLPRRAHFESQARTTASIGSVR